MTDYESNRVFMNSDEKSDENSDEKSYKLCIYPFFFPELDWIRILFPDFSFLKWNEQIPYEVLKISKTSAKIKIIFIYHVDFQLIFAKLSQFFEKRGIFYEVIHCGDEYGTDDLSWYGLSHCLKIYRHYIYPRESSEWPSEHLSKIFIIPLGSLHFDKENNIETNTDRKYLWSFAGRNNVEIRNILLDFFHKYNPYYEHLIPDFLHSTKKNSDEYKKILKNTKIVPIFPGTNLETFRFYEAIEFGCVPLYFRFENDGVYFAFLKKIFPMLLDISVNKVDEVMSELSLNQEFLELYATQLNNKWNHYKKNPKDVFVSLKDILDQ